MSSPAASPRSPVAQAGWIVAVLLLGWVGFIFLPFGGPKDPEPLPPPPPRPPSELRKVGLRDNVDWEQMPGIFAVWADRAEWKNDRTLFAYWNPSAQDFTYHFEAIRTADGYRFKEWPPADDMKYLDEAPAADCPIRFYRTFGRSTIKPLRTPRPKLIRETEPGSVEVDLGKVDLEVSVKPVGTDPKK